MRGVFGIGKPRGLVGGWAAACAAIYALRLAHLRPLEPLLLQNHLSALIPLARYDSPDHPPAIITFKPLNERFFNGLLTTTYRMSGNVPH